MIIIIKVLEISKVLDPTTKVYQIFKIFPSQQI